MNSTLAIAIPTYNRAKRLDKSLTDLLLHIRALGDRRDLVSVFVSNNGSSDHTESVIRTHEKEFLKLNIGFSHHHFNENQGFDQNVLKCYEGCNSQYVWFLSDDDNILENAISVILDDINCWQPHVLYYNFDQTPYSPANPYITATEFFDRLSEENFGCLKKVINWPKLTSIVLKSSPNIALELKGLDLGFMHVALFLDQAIKCGRLLFSPRFVARPDIDYMDNIDFPPFIKNSLQESLFIVLSGNDRMDFMPALGVEREDPLVSSMMYLGAGYRGRFKIPDHLRESLLATIRNELTYQGLRQRNKSQLFLSLLKFSVSYGYHLVSRYSRFLGRRSGAKINSQRNV